MVYPLDTMKTIIQVQNLGERTMTQFEVIKLISKRSGVKGFFKGLSPCVARAFIVNSVVFYSNEVLHEMLNPCFIKV